MTFSASFSLVLLSTLSAVANAAESGCVIDKFRIWLRNDKQRESWREEDSERELVADLNNGDIVCYENFGDNIEAVLADGCTDTVQFHLFDEFGTLYAKRWENEAPYFLYGDWIKPNGEVVVLGETIVRGRYTLKVAPVNNRDATKEIEFQVGSCYRYRPANECSTCVDGQVCVGSRCVAEGYNRFSLTYDGWSYAEKRIKITTPDGNVIAAIAKPDAGEVFPTSDPVSGGFVEEDYRLEGCRSRGMWVKNFIFPSQDLAPTGTYTIEMEDDEVCGLGGYIFPIPFDLEVYQNGELVQSFSETDGNTLSVDL